LDARLHYIHESIVPMKSQAAWYDNDRLYTGHNITQMKNLRIQI